ncbi:alpha/beta hydrolase [Jiella sp. MQZ9-1]|uniref:Alpha/beta hydrolase n=1 Tax=Jiella flava TaxID=2816857 RepID=A0A939FWB9_9HYPH|nr:alpha/beta hydrolase [Jiella flava]MBO0663173.1 alpha/beta hydrolase [Jiella flava]MCD2471591.1 alpha/beta hydrolase [Jiella flava]
MAKARLEIDPAAFDPDAADPELVKLNDWLRDKHRQRPDTWSLPIEAVRHARKAGKGIFPFAPRDKKAETHIHIGSAGREIAMRIIRPSNGATRGTFLHIHGGGWVFGGSEESDPWLRRLADNTGLTVVSVEYRLAPEHPFPAAPDDCTDVAAALAKGHLPVPRGFLAIGGESAGAHLAVLTLLRLRDDYQLRPFGAALLVAGCYDLSLTPSVRAAGEERLVLNTDDVKEFVLRFVPDDYGLKDPHVSPLYADLQGLPPARFSCGTADLLIDDTLFMASRWLSAGNAVELHLTNAGAHVFEAFPSGAGIRSLDGMEAYLRERIDFPA